LHVSTAETSGTTLVGFAPVTWRANVHTGEVAVGTAEKTLFAFTVDACSSAREEQHVIGTVIGTVVYAGV